MSTSAVYSKSGQAYIDIDGISYAIYASVPSQTSLLKFSLKTNLVKSIISEIVSNISKYYYVYGRSTPWLDETSPEAVSESYQYENEVRNEMLLYKQIDANDIAAVVPRVNWIAGYTFDMYDEYSSTNPAYSGATSLETAEFYCLTDDYNVYKCLYNNNNSPSSQRPIGTSTDSITLDDHYIWKYMYTVPLSVRNKFLTNLTMPVVTALSNQFYSKGSIVAFNIDNPGAKYPVTSYKITGFRIIDGGSGYNQIPTVQLSSPDQTGGTTATIQSVTLSGGQISSITMASQGSGYSYPPIVTIIGTASRAASLEPIVERIGSTYTNLVVTGDGCLEENPYQVSSIDVLTGGSGYSALQFLFKAPDLPNGVIAAATGVITDVVLPGTLVALNNSTTVTGVGTNFLTSLVVGSAIKIGSNLYQVTAVASNTSLTINNSVTTTNGALIYKAGVVTSTVIGTPIASGNFIIGKQYTITTSGNTSFPGAANNNPGTTFTASGSGTGTGYAVLTVSATGYGYSKPFYSITQNSNASNIVLISATSISGQIGSGFAFNVNSHKNEAELVPLINLNGEIEALQIIKPGIGYTYATVNVVTSLDTINTAGFIPASILLSFGIGDIESRQSTVELTALDGAIHAIKILSHGSLYTSVPTVTITGDGSGCTAVATLDAFGSINSILVNSYGTNYTKATATITGGGVTNSSITTTSLDGITTTVGQTVAHAIISPKGGHGRDAVAELYSKTLVLHGNLSKEKNSGFTSTNDYRQICIIKNPKVYGKNYTARTSLASACITVIGGNSGAGITLINKDDILTYTNSITNRSYTYRVVEKNMNYSSTEAALLLAYLDNVIPPVGATLSRFSGTPAAFSSTAIINPDINKFSGELLTVDNRNSFSPSSEQIVVALNSITF